MTTALVAANVLIFLVLWGLGATYPDTAQAVHHVLWNSPSLVAQKLWLWQIVTANFVHNGIIHLSVNTFFVLWLGPRLEGLLGARRFAFLYLGSGVFGYAAYDVFGAALAGLGTTGGASGCVLGMAVAYTLSFPKRVVRLYGFLRVPFRWIVVLFVFSGISSFFWPGGIPWINNVVHLGGAAFGAALSSLVSPKRPARGAADDRVRHPLRPGH